MAVNQENGKVTILGYNEAFAWSPDVIVYKDGKEVGVVGRNMKVELDIDSPCVLTFKCWWRTEKSMVKPGDWVLLSFNRFWGTLNATITDEGNYQFAMNKAKGDDARNWIWTIIFIALLAALAIYFN